MEYLLEEREEVCSVASKLVKLTIYRYPSVDPQDQGEIGDFHFNNSSESCESRCTYKMLMNDY